jgi:CRP-like cAMP-binding protein
MQEYLSSFNLLTTDEVEHVLALGTVRRLRQGAFLIRAGMVCQEVAFVESGLFRSFYYNSQGEEVTYCFTFSGSFVTAYSSFISQEKTMENIHAATDTEVFSIPRNAILALENTSMNWLRSGPVKTTYIAVVKGSSDLWREKWLEQIRKLGAVAG